jgi:hypothetical protein
MNPIDFIRLLRKHSISTKPPNYSAYDLSVAEILEQWYYNPITNHIYNRYNNYTIMQTCKLLRKYIKRCPKWNIFQNLSFNQCYICEKHLSSKDMRSHCLDKHTQEYCLNFVIPNTELKIRDIINNSAFLKVIQTVDHPDLIEVRKQLNI